MLWQIILLSIFDLCTRRNILLHFFLSLFFHLILISALSVYLLEYLWNILNYFCHKLKNDAFTIAIMNQYQYWFNKREKWYCLDFLKYCYNPKLNYPFFLFPPKFDNLTLKEFEICLKTCQTSQMKVWLGYIIINNICMISYRLSSKLNLMTFHFPSKF